jgi:hypothetical protein
MFKELFYLDRKELPSSEMISGPLQLRPDRYALRAEVLPRAPCEKLSSHQSLRPASRAPRWGSESTEAVHISEAVQF